MRAISHQLNSFIVFIYCCGLFLAFGTTSTKTVRSEDGVSTCKTSTTIAMQEEVATHEQYQCIVEGFDPKNGELTSVNLELRADMVITASLENLSSNTSITQADWSIKHSILRLESGNSEKEVEYISSDIPFGVLELLPAFDSIKDLQGKSSKTFDKVYESTISKVELTGKENIKQLLNKNGENKISIPIGVRGIRYSQSDLAYSSLVAQSQIQLRIDYNYRPTIDILDIKTPALVTKNEDFDIEVSIDSSTPFSPNSFYYISLITSAPVRLVVAKDSHHFIQQVSPTVWSITAKVPDTTTNTLTIPLRLGFVSLSADTILTLTAKLSEESQDLSRSTKQKEIQLKNSMQVLPKKIVENQSNTNPIYIDQSILINSDETIPYSFLRFDMIANQVGGSLVYLQPTGEKTTITEEKSVPSSQGVYFVPNADYQGEVVLNYTFLDESLVPIASSRLRFVLDSRTVPPAIATIAVDDELNVFERVSLKKNTFVCTHLHVFENTCSLRTFT